VQGSIVPLDVAAVWSLAHDPGVQILGEVEFPDWICRDPDTRVVAFTADVVWMEVVPELVEALTQGGQGMIHILDIGDLVTLTGGLTTLVCLGRCRSTRVPRRRTLSMCCGTRIRP
jgi:hypothetical protein